MSDGTHIETRIPQRMDRLPWSGRHWMVVLGFLIAAALMLVAAVSEAVLGVDAEQESLEDVAAPLSAESA